MESERGSANHVDPIKEAADERFQAASAGSTCWYQWGPSGQQHHALECCHFWVSLHFPFPILWCLCFFFFFDFLCLFRFLWFSCLGLMIPLGMEVGNSQFIEFIYWTAFIPFHFIVIYIWVEYLYIVWAYVVLGCAWFWDLVDDGCVSNKNLDFGHSLVPFWLFFDQMCFVFLPLSSKKQALGRDVRKFDSSLWVWDFFFFFQTSSDILMELLLIIVWL